MHLRFEAKMPGLGMRMRSVEIDFHFGEDSVRPRSLTPMSGCCWTP